MRDLLVYIGAVAGAITISTSVSLLWQRWSPLRRFLKLFYGMEKYRRRAKQDPREKRLIGRYVARWLLRGENGASPLLFLESGTTAAEVGLALLQEGKAAVYTNNLLVSLAFAGKELGASCHLLPGIIDENYPGVVGEETIEWLGRILHLCGAAVVNATAFNIVFGPCVNSAENQAIKRYIIENAPAVYICFSSRKMVPSLRRKEDNDVPPVFKGDHRWRTLLRERDLHLVVGVPPRWSWRKRQVFDTEWRELTVSLRRWNMGPEVVTTDSDRVRHIHLPSGGGTGYLIEEGSEEA